MRTTPRRLAAVAGFLALLACATATADARGEFLLVVENAPADGLVAAPVDLAEVLGDRPAEPRDAPSLRVEARADGHAVPATFVPDPPRDGAPSTGTVVLRLPPGGARTVRLRLRREKEPPEKTWRGTVKTPAFSVTHRPDRMGGLPCRIEFADSGKVFEGFAWNDRVHHGERGGFSLRHDPEPRVTLLRDGALCTVVRVRARYVRPNDAPESRPRACYTWTYFKDRPLAHVAARVTQDEPFRWDELHFLELNFQKGAWTHWAGGEPSDRGEFRGGRRSFSFGRWGAVLDGRNAMAVLRGGRPRIYDGGNGYGSYLHACGDRAWQGWGGTERRFSAWLWIGSGEKPVEQVRAATRGLPSDVHAVASLPAVRDAVGAARQRAEKLAGRARRDALWRAAMAERLEAEGQFRAAVRAARGELPDSWTTLPAGDLRLTLQQTAGGVALRSLYDAGTGSELLAAEPPPLFTLTVRSTEDGRETKLSADAGWQDVEVAREGGQVTARWRGPEDGTAADLSVTARAMADPRRQAVRWSLRVRNDRDGHTLWRVEFPRVALAEPGPDGAVCFPRGPGEVQKGLWRRSFSYTGRYPGGWTSMQFMAAYDETERTGLYVAAEDPRASTKKLALRSDPEGGSVEMSFGHPVPHMGKGGNDFELSGRATWQLLRGDWFDAARIYRRWVRGEAAWYPELSPQGRADTPRWMRELCAWALGGGRPEQCVQQVGEFADFLGVPVGFHWYHWHRIPFDNDYPHYFPTEEGFAEGVAELKESNVFPMPYINGRLWDTHDGGSEDAEFTSVALPAATKGPDGRPYTETYGSKEEDGSPVRLAVMCPTTDLWQGRVRRIVLRLVRECGVSGVYVDQVAAAAPTLCMDPEHDHPAGGGHWWMDGYGEMLEAIHRRMPEDRILTTECNAEPFLRWFDGYLTWHWQHDGQVAAFPAVYGGAIQMFGRAYRGGPTRERALRMKAGQQLVFGEQIGWIGPGVVNREESARFLRDVVRLRHRLREYFYRGRMERPPALSGDVPTVRADWRWHGEWPVTTDAVLTGTWSIPGEDRAVLMFVNVSGDPVTAGFDFQAAEYGLECEKVTVRVIGSEGEREEFTGETRFTREMHFPAGEPFAWEVTPAR